MLTKMAIKPATMVTIVASSSIFALTFFNVLALRGGRLPCGLARILLRFVLFKDYLLSGGKPRTLLNRVRVLLFMGSTDPESST
jgi:hypothetical protein